MQRQASGGPASGSAPISANGGGPAAAAPGPDEPDAQLPPDRDFERIAGTTSFLVRRQWLISDPVRRAATGGFVTPTRTAVLLRELVGAGILSWAKPDRLATAADRLVLLDGSKGQAVIRVSLGAGAYNVIGLPPGTGAMVARVQGGLELTVAAEGVEEGGPPIQLDAAQIDDALDAVERFTQLTIPSARRHDLVIKASAGAGTFRIHLSRENLIDLVGAGAWRGFSERESSKDGAREAVGAGVAVNSDLTDLELERARKWLQANLPSSKHEGVRIDRALLDVILTIERSPHRARIIAELAAGEGGAAVTAISVEAAVREATYEAERDAIGIESPRPTANLDPVHDVALPARIVQHASKIASGDSVPFSVEVDWPPVAIDRAQGDEYRYRQFVTNVDWVFEKGTTHDKAYGSQRYTGGHATHNHVFRLAAGEEQATWIVHAFVRHSHFQPVHETRSVVVQTEAALMRDLREDATAGMGSLYQDPDKKNFDTGVLNNKAGSEKQDKGLSFHGRLPIGFSHTTDAQRDQRRAEEMNQVRAMIEHLRGRPQMNTDAIEAAERYLANLERADGAIERDAGSGWQSFEVRGTLRAKQAGVEDGALQLHGSLRRRDDGFIGVQLRDLSRRFGAEDLRTEGYGSDFAEALEEAFVPLCKAYPAGRLFILAQDYQGLRAMQTTIGFELDTGTVGEDIKAKVWDPAVKIAINLAGLAATLAGFGAIALPALAVYNGLETVDQLHEEYVRGTLSTTDLSLGLASLALDMMPALGRVKSVAGSTRAMFMLSLADTAGEALYMTAAAHLAIRDLEDMHVAQLVDQWERMVEMQSRTDAADPAMRAMQAQFDAKAEDVKKASTHVIAGLVAQRALFVAAKRAGEVVLARGGGGATQPRWKELSDDGVFVARPDGAPYYDPSKGQIVGNPAKLTDGQLDELVTQQGTHMRLLSTQLADDLRLPLTDVEVMVGDDVVVSVGKSGGVTATYKPGMAPDAVRAQWREQHGQIVAGRAGAAPPQRENGEDSTGPTEARSARLGAADSLPAATAGRPSASDVAHSRLLALANNDSVLIDDFLRLAGEANGDGVATRLENLLTFAASRGASVAECRDLLQIAAGDAERFRELVGQAMRFGAHRASVPNPQPANLIDPTGALNFASANTVHVFQRHVYDYFDATDIKAANTFFPPGTTPAMVIADLEVGIERLRIHYSTTIPMQGSLGVQIGDRWMQIGWRTQAGKKLIGQFFPGSGPGVENISGPVMTAIAKIIGS